MKISVLMCTYNGAKYIKEQLDSILCQSMNIDEIIIVDDNSSDNTVSIIKGYLNKNIKLICNKKNMGIKKNYYQALKKCHGDIIFMADQDDIWNLDKVLKITNYFNKHRNINMIGTNARIIDKDSKISNKTLYDLVDFNYTKDNINTNFNCMLLKPFLTGTTCAIRKSFLDKYMEEYTYFYHDEWLSFMAAYNDSLYMMDELLTSYRLYNNTVGFNKKNKIVNLINKLLSNKDLIKKNKYRCLQFLEINNFIKRNNIINKYNDIIEKAYEFYEVRSNNRYSYKEYIKLIRKFKYNNYYKLFTKHYIYNYYRDLLKFRGKD